MNAVSTTPFFQANNQADLQANNQMANQAGNFAGVALVTGAAKRLGREIALELARAGWNIALHYHHSASEAENTAQAIRTLGRQVITLQADLSDASALQNLFVSAQQLGCVRAVINNASLFEYDSIESLNQAHLQAHMQTNLLAPLFLARALFLSIKHENAQARSAMPGSEKLNAPDKAGVVVNLLDQKLFNPNPDFLSYTLSKSALHSATTLLAQALAPQVRVVGVAPGITLASGKQSDAEFARAHAATPLGRSSSALDVARTVRFAVECESLTGTTLLVDGGQHLMPLSRDVMFLT